MKGAIEAFEAECIKVGGWIGRQRPTAEASEPLRDPSGSIFPESSDTSAPRPGGRVFKDQQ